MFNGDGGYDGFIFFLCLFKWEWRWVGGGTKEVSEISKCLFSHNVIAEQVLEKKKGGND